MFNLNDPLTSTQHYIAATQKLWVPHGVEDWHMDINSDVSYPPLIVEE